MGCICSRSCRVLRASVRSLGRSRPGQVPSCSVRSVAAVAAALIVLPTAAPRRLPSNTIGRSTSRSPSPFSLLSLNTAPAADSGSGGCASPPRLWLLASCLRLWLWFRFWHFPRLPSCRACCLLRLRLWLRLRLLLRLVMLVRPLPVGRGGDMCDRQADSGCGGAGAGRSMEQRAAPADSQPSEAAAATASANSGQRQAYDLRKLGQPQL